MLYCSEEERASSPSFQTLALFYDQCPLLDLIYIPQGWKKKPFYERDFKPYHLKISINHIFLLLHGYSQHTVRQNDVLCKTRGVWEIIVKCKDMSGVVVLLSRSDQEFSVSYLFKCSTVYFMKNVHQNRNQLKTRNFGE